MLSPASQIQPPGFDLGTSVPQVPPQSQPPAGLCFEAFPLQVLSPASQSQIPGFDPEIFLHHILSPAPQIQTPGFDLEPLLPQVPSLDLQIQTPGFVLQTVLPQAQSPVQQNLTLPGLSEDFLLRTQPFPPLSPSLQLNFPLSTLFSPHVKAEGFDWIVQEMGVGFLELSLALHQAVYLHSLSPSLAMLVLGFWVRSDFRLTRQRFPVPASQRRWEIPTCC